MKHTINTLSDIDLINTGDIEALLNRHSLLLKKLASNHAIKYPNTTFEDCLQNAKVGLILAVKRFDINSSVKFITFLHKTVYYYLLTCNDEESFVKCPPVIREIKSYFSGAYNHSKKTAFEQKHNLNNNDDIQNLENEYKILSSEAIITTDKLPEVLCNSENEIISATNLKITIDSFPE